MRLRWRPPGRVPCALHVGAYGFVVEVVSDGVAPGGGADASLEFVVEGGGDDGLGDQGVHVSGVVEGMVGGVGGDGEAEVGGFLGWGWVLVG